MKYGYKKDPQLEIKWFRLPFLVICWYERFLWFEVFGYGLSFKNYGKYVPFSLRKGYKPHLKIGNVYIEPLTRKR